MESVELSQDSGVRSKGETPKHHGDGQREKREPRELRRSRQKRRLTERPHQRQCRREGAVRTKYQRGVRPDKDQICHQGSCGRPKRWAGC